MEKKELVYLAVSRDQYELPIAIELSPVTLAKKMGVSYDTVYQGCRGNSSAGKRLGLKFEKIQI